MANSVIKYRLSGSEQTTYNVMKYHLQGSNYTHKDQDNEAVGYMLFSLIIQIDVSNEIWANVKLHTQNSVISKKLGGCRSNH